MNWLAMVFAVFLIVLLVGTAFSYGGIRGPWQGTVWFFLVLFLGTLAIGAWAEPVGPRAWGVPWLGLIVTAIFVGLLIAITTPSKGSRRQHVKRLPLEDDAPRGDGGHDDASVEPETQPAPLDPRQSIDDGAEAATAVNVIFGFFVVFAIILILIRFFALVAPAV